MSAASKKITVMKPLPKPAPTKGVGRDATKFKVGEARPMKAVMARNDQTFYRDKFTQALISTLSEIDASTNKEKIYVLCDRLVALGLGVEFTVNGKKHHYAPDLKAIKEILDRLIGKPRQQIDVAPAAEGGVTIIFDVPGDEEQ